MIIVTADGARWKVNKDGYQRRGVRPGARRELGFVFLRCTFLPFPLSLRKFIPALSCPVRAAWQASLVRPRAPCLSRAGDRPPHGQRGAAGSGPDAPDARRGQDHVGSNGGRYGGGLVYTGCAFDPPLPQPRSWWREGSVHSTGPVPTKVKIRKITVCESAGTFPSTE